MEKKGKVVRMALTHGQQIMFEDIYGVKVEEIHWPEEAIIPPKGGWNLYRPPIFEGKDIREDIRLQRMYLEPEQKEQVGAQLGVKTDLVTNYIELDPHVPRMYNAMVMSGLIHKGD